MIYIFNFCSKFVLGRKSPFSFELHSSGRGKDERQVLFYCASGHGSGHQRGVLGGHDLAAIAWSLVFLTGALHSSGLTQIPALSFWQSVGVLLLVFLLSIPLRAGRINISKEGKGER